MKIRFQTGNLTEATKESLKIFTEKSYRKIERLIQNSIEAEPELKISIDKSGSEFSITAELRTFKFGNFLTTATNRDLRLAINETSRELKLQLTKEKDRSI